MNQFKPLTSLRLFLALWVLCRHYFTVYGPEGAFFHIGFTSTYFDHGYLGVDGFFILSGFILAYNYDPAPGQPLNLKRFIVARIARIYPVYLVCLLAFAAAVLVRDYALHTQIVGTSGYRAPDFLLELFMLSAWRYAGGNGWNDVGWSVSAEWFAYVFFPLFLLAAPRFSRIRILLAGCVALVVLAAVEAASPDHLSLSGGVARLVPEFMLGVLLCRLREAVPDHGGYAWGALVSLAVCATGVAVGVDTLFVAGAAGLVFSLSYKNDVLTRALSLRSLVFLGEVSYCLYIVQRIPQYMFAFARRQLPGLTALPAAVQATLLLALTVGVAILLHFAIEKPMRRCINRRFDTKAKAQPAKSPWSVHL
ncbi:acyltransferase [Cupriavidus sp. WKF15]|uniref:acyltransferase family protein n=1 Tax=Cupriavidus sp. WKF15 TaxID=3032282 RepID=UPI0023E1ED83|nr:acyltransferase [Cupriavidus sp. WKF15]WER49566.1 acyltransferase [Cupriavidus sp. WKF15]